MGKVYAIGAVIVLFLSIIIGRQFLDIVHVNGNECYVRQHWQRGVVDEVFTSGTHYILGGWAWEAYRFDIGTQKITFDSNKTNEDAEYGSFEISVGENGGQKVWISLSANYRVGWKYDDKGNIVFDPSLLVALYKDGLRTTYESVVLKREIQDVINEVARPRTALELYSGTGFVKFKDDVETAIKNSKVLTNRGILVENVIIYNVGLDPAYESEIKAKQIAEQKKLRFEKETSASEQEAKKVFAESQSAVEKVRQESESRKIAQVTAASAAAEQAVIAAEADKKKTVLSAEAEKASTVLAAEADNRKTVLAAEAERDAGLAVAAGITARGEANARIKQLESTALYDGPGGARRAEVEIAVAKANLLKGLLEGAKILPADSLKTLVNGSGALVSVGDESSSK